MPRDLELIPSAWREEFYLRVGRRVTHWRGVRGLSSAQLAGAIGAPRRVVTAIEGGNMPIPVDLFWRLAAALHVAPKTLMPRLANSRASRRRQRIAQRVEVLTARDG